MPEVQRSAETNDHFSEDPNFSLICRLLKSRYTRIFALLLMTMGIIGCARESKLLRKESCENYNARTYRDSSGTHGYKKIIVYPTDSIEDGYRCVVKPECQNLNKDEEKPDPKDCVDWSKPCKKQ